MSADPDVVVIGSGPNGLVGACMLARAGLKVVVCEANTKRAGGALGSTEATLPGYVHDVGAAFFTFAAASPAFRALDLGRHGLRFVHAEIDSAHPAPDGSVAILSRDLDLMSRHFGSPEDGEVWRRWALWHRGIESRLLAAMLGSLLPIRAGLGLLPMTALTMGLLFTASGARTARRLFRSPAAQRVIPGLALHSDVGPHDRFGTGIGWMLAAMATSGGYPVPVGGAQTITEALLAELHSLGGSLRLGARVERVLVADRRACGVRLADGEEIRCRQGVLADTAAPSLFLDLVEGQWLPGRVKRRMRQFPWGWGTFKVDWALDGPVPWTCELSRRASVVHAGDDIEDLARFTDQVRRGELPEHPYLVIGQQSLIDPSRAPAGGHTLWAYTRVPATAPGGWTDQAEVMADRIDARIEGLAPGFRSRIRARRIVTPHDLQAGNANLHGGDLGGGSNAWHRQLIFRPLFPWYRHRTPLAGLYLGSSFCHPGPGVHGMAGFNAAAVMLADFR